GSVLEAATGLTIYGMALAVAGVAVFSAREAVVIFATAILGGCAVGLAVGWSVAQLRARIQDTPVEMTISFLTPYAAFLPAHRLGVSGVIATVAAGLLLGPPRFPLLGPAPPPPCPA